MFAITARKESPRKSQRRERHCLCPRLESLENRSLLTGIICSPVAVLNNTGGDYAPENAIGLTIDQSGLSSGFTKCGGLDVPTDFDTYIATNPTHSPYIFDEWWSLLGVHASTIVYDMGVGYTLDRLALWNEESSGIATLVVSTSNDPTFNTSTTVGTFSPTNHPLLQPVEYGADVFDILDTTARYVRLQVTGPQVPFGFNGIAMGEIAFSTMSPPQVEIEINGTADENDDITLFNPVPSSHPFVQTIQAVVRNAGPDGTFDLVVEPAGRVTLSKTSFNLKSGQSETITITPAVTSGSVNDVVIKAKVGTTYAGQEDMTVAQVDFAQQIRNADTPAGMRDRIPPRIDTPVQVVVSPNLAGSGQHVTLAVNNQDANNGTVTLNGAATWDITSSGGVNLRGVTQTASGGHFSNLRPMLRVRGQDTIQSDGFSVSAIVVNFQQTSARDIGGGFLEFEYTWASDSGNLADLDQVWFGEHVTYSDGGIHAGPRRPWNADNFDPSILPPRAPGNATLGTATDIHRPPGGLPRPGLADSYTATQYYGFHDYRTDDRADDKSLGWQVNLTPAITISRYVELVTVGHRRVWQYRITKSGVTAIAPLV